jgi:HAD superfamily hydrolase (TIGR01509 family)
LRADFEQYGLLGAHTLIEAVVLDFDGLMAESESLGYKVWRAFLAEHDAEITDEEYASLIGTEGPSSARLVLGYTGIDCSVEEILEYHRNHRAEVFRREGKANPGLYELLDELKDRGLKLAVASNSRRDYIESNLEVLGVREMFACVRALDDVALGKPAPDVFLAAAAGLGVDPQSCLAAEDSPIGMTSALAAGMRVVVVPNQHIENGNYQGAFAQFNSLIDLRLDLDTLLA